MIYTSGIVSSLKEEETLEKLQDNKLTVVCEKVCMLRIMVTRMITPNPS